MQVSFHDFLVALGFRSSSVVYSFKLIGLSNRTIASSRFKEFDTFVNFTSTFDNSDTFDIQRLYEGMYEQGLLLRVHAPKSEGYHERVVVMSYKELGEIAELLGFTLNIGG